MDPGTPLPAGTITFLFTDIEGSTRLWEQHSETMRAALVRHDALLLGYVAQHEGDCERAARLLGASDALLDAISRCLDPAERAELECHAAAVRTALGEDPFTAAWAAGRAMSLDEASLSPYGKPPPPDQPRGTPAAAADLASPNR